MAQRPLRIVPKSAEEEAPDRSAVPTFDEFFAVESEDLFRRMWLVTRDRHEAEEVMQDAFLSMFERWDRIDTVEDPKAYLYRTAFNAWKRRSRRAARMVKTVLSTAGHDEADGAEARTVIGDALARLTPRQRAAVVLTELIGYSSEEAGEILGIRPVTARVLTSQARAAMRTYLGGPDD